MAATGRIMGWVSQRLILLGLEQAHATETLEITALILPVILSICGLSSFVLVSVTNVDGIFLQTQLLKIRIRDVIVICRNDTIYILQCNGGEERMFIGKGLPPDLQHFVNNNKLKLTLLVTL